MICPNCGKEQVGNPKFCRNCGHPLHPSSQPTAAETPAQTQSQPPVMPTAPVGTVRLRLATRGVVAAFFTLLGLFSVSASVGLVFGLVLVAAYVDPGSAGRSTVFADPATRPFVIGTLIGIPLAVVTGIGMAAVWTSAKVRMVAPLLPGSRRDYVLSEEGIYTRQLASRFGNKLYRLRPWESLSLHLVDDKRQQIVLKQSKTLLRLRARIDFAAARSTVLAHLPPDRLTPPKRAPAFRWGVLSLAVFVVIAADLGARVLLMALSTGHPGDGACDLCGASLGRLGIVVYATKAGSIQLIHEYCELHAVGFALTHPESPVMSLIDVLAGRVGGGTGGAEIILTYAAAVFWGYIIWLIIRLPLPLWRRVRLLKE